MTSSAVAGENEALANVLRSYKSNPEDLSGITKFLSSYPNSRWCASLDLNLGLKKFRKGYLSDALNLWKSSWELSKSESGQLQKSVADRALALVMTLNARLGNQSDLRTYFAEIKNRPLSGSNESLIAGASTGLWTMEHHPDIAFKCGPYAVSTLLNLKNKTHANFNPIIENVKSTSQGTNLAQVKGWADAVGLKYQMAKRTKGAPVIVPSVVHWKLGHFGAMTSKNNDVYILQDPTFDLDATAGVSTQALDQESDGYFLVPAGPLPQGWSPVSEDEGKTVWGKGVTIAREYRDMLFGADSGMKGCGKPCCPGMAQANFWKMNATLNILDTPLMYHPPIGPDITFRLNYSHLEPDQPSTFTFTNFGPDWTCNWFSYLTVDGGTQAALVRVGGGGSELYPQSGGVYTNALLTQALLVKIGTNNYQRQMPDGSIQVFDQIDGSGNIFMTKIIDPQGNSALIQYDANFRISTVTDAINQVSTFTYVSNTVGNAGFYKVASISDPFGRSCSFSYNSAVNNLVSITDSIGLVSKFAYESTATFITLLSTAYGQTSFYHYSNFTDPTYPGQGLRLNYPDGTTAVIENWVNRVNKSYYWNREATMLYPSDPANRVYTHCEVTNWLTAQAAELLRAVPAQVTKPLEAGAPLNIFHTGDNAQYYVGTSNKPILTTKFLGNPNINATIGGTITAGDTVNLYIQSPAGFFTPQNIVYTVQAGDTLSKIAIGLANAINTNPTLRTVNMFAAANGPIVGLSSGETSYELNSSVDTRYTPSTSVGATETIAVNSPTPQLEVVTILGTITPGNNMGIRFLAYNPAPGHAEDVYYTIQAGDTYSTIAAAYAANINANVYLQGYNTTATAVGSNIYISTSISGRVQYSYVGGGTLNFNFGPALNSGFEIHQYQNNSFGLITQSIDPVGRTFTYQYASNNIDLQQITETQGTDNFLIGSWTYNSNHRPLTYTDASGQVTNYAYNSSGQLITVTDANSNVTTMTYTGTSSATIGGTVTAGNVLTITVHDAGLTGGQKAINYTVVAGNTLTTIATGLKNAINADTSLQAIGVTATSSAAVITLLSTSVNITTYTQSTSGGATETIALGPNTFGYLTKIDGPLSGSQDVTTMTYDSVGRLASQTDSEGYVLTFNYDNADRLTKTTYPDATTEQTIYSRLDAILKKDRIGRWSRSAFDSMDQLSFETDPLGRKTKYSWCICGALASLTDPLGKVTSWHHDLEGRPIVKTYADQTTTQYNYEANTSRLRSQKDALGQTKFYSYNSDNTNYQMAFQDAVNPTDNVTNQYDPKFKRLTKVGKNDWGTYSYTYNPYFIPLGTPTTGGGMLQLVHNDVIPNSDITYSYDVLGRTTNRSINGATNSITWAYDAMSRITSEANALGSFAYAYVDNTTGSSKGTTRLSSISYPNSQTTNFNWYGNKNDQRLQQIINLNPTGGLLSQFDYGYDPAGEITQWQQQQNGNNQFFNLAYDTAGQLTTAQVGSGSPLPPYSAEYYYGYDGSSNRTSAQNASTQNVRIGGTVTTGDTVTATVVNSALSGGQTAITYTVVGGDTLATIASGLAAAITANASLQAAGVSAVATSSLLSIRSVSPNVTSYTLSKSGGATETIAFAIFKNGIENATIGGSKTTGNTLTITVKDAALTGGQKAITYTVLSTDTLTTIATAITSAINADTSLQAIGVAATSAGTVVSISSTSTNPTTFAQSTSTGATETITLLANTNIPTLISLTGTKTTGDVITITFFDSGLTGGSKAVAYTVLAGDTLTSIATGIAAAINADTGLQGVAVSATSAQTIVTVKSKSPNPTTYRQTTNTGATELIAITTQPNAFVTATVGGTKTTGNVLTLTVFDTALTGGQQAIPYTVLAGDTLTTIATGIAAAVNANTNLQNIGVTATAKNTVVSLQSTSPNLTTYVQSVSAGSTETISLSTGVGVTEAAYNNVNELVALAPGGDTRFQGVTNKAIKSASIATQVVNITASPVAQTSYAQSVSTGATETIAFGTNLNGNTTATIGGTKTTGDILTLTIENSNLSGGQTSIPYTVLAGDTLTTIASSLASAINSNSSLQGIGVAASSSLAVITTTVTGTTYTTSTSGGATETLTMSANVQGNTSASVGGIVTTGNTLTVTTHSPLLTGGQRAVTYTVLSTDTLVSIAAGIAAAINADTSLQTLGVKASSSNAATLAFSESFSGNATLPTAMSTANVSAVDGANNTKTNGYALSVNGGSTTSLTYDLNGNMTSDGTNAFAWDAENRMIKITYPGTNNFSSFVYDGLSRNVSIVETVAGSVTSTKQFVWAGSNRKEERDGSGALTKKFFERGQMNLTTKYFYDKDHLGTVREMTDNSGVIQAQYAFDPFGRVTKLSEAVASDFGYAGYYSHSRSGLNLTRTRAYASTLGRFINRDPIEETGGVNLYSYVGNMPVSFIDGNGTRGGLSDIISAGLKGVVAGPSVITGALGISAEALIISINNWIDVERQQECGKACVAQLEADLVKGMDPVAAYKKFICCLKDKCKFNMDQVNKIDNDHNDWQDAYNKTLQDEIEKQLQELKKQLDPFKDLIQPPPFKFP